mmetsp:Transcript_107883/g.310845  ORF Transcript_107883/g.310845 Transcript_107883/m.310845 type:complete len:201 (-) Transcript_107883:59-661(-)
MRGSGVAVAEALFQSIHPCLDRACDDLHLVPHPRVLDDLRRYRAEQRVDLHAHQPAKLGQAPGNAQSTVATIGAQFQANLRLLVPDRGVQHVLADVPRLCALHAEVVRPELVHRGQDPVHAALFDRIDHVHEELALAAVHERSPVVLLADLHHGARGLRVHNAAAEDRGGQGSRGRNSGNGMPRRTSCGPRCFQAPRSDG